MTLTISFTRVLVTDGMVDGARETFDGSLRVRMWRSRSQVGSSTGGDEECEEEPPADGRLLLDATSSRAALELGGGPWEQQWSGACKVSALAQQVLSADVPLDKLRDQIPGY